MVLLLSVSPALALHMLAVVLMVLLLLVALISSLATVRLLVSLISSLATVLLLVAPFSFLLAAVLVALVVALQPGLAEVKDLLKQFEQVSLQKTEQQPLNRPCSSHPSSGSCVNSESGSCVDSAVRGSVR